MATPAVALRRPVEAAPAVATQSRIPSMDQLRGYAILGMLLVDYFELFDASTPQLHHHREFMTYADTVAPMFMFVVGMGMRLSILRRREKVGLREARNGLLKRYALLTLIAFTLYTGYLWDALMNIALAGLIALWVVERKPSERVLFGLGMLVLYQAIFSLTTYGGWLLGTVKYTEDTLPLIWRIIPIGPTLMDVRINGGPLGHWSWLLMMLMGTVAYDILATKNGRKIVLSCLALGVAFSIAGWALRMPWGDVKAEWVFSKYYVTAPYALWSTGICFFTMLAFYLLCDAMHLRIPTLTVLGMNPLFIYILQWCIMETAHRFVPGDTQNWLVIMGGFALFFGLVYGTALYLYKKNIFIKL